MSHLTSSLSFDTLCVLFVLSIRCEFNFDFVGWFYKTITQTMCACDAYYTILMITLHAVNHTSQLVSVIVLRYGTAYQISKQASGI